MVFRHSLITPYKILVVFMCLLAMTTFRGSLEGSLARNVILSFAILVTLITLYRNNIFSTISATFIWVNLLLIWYQQWIISELVVVAGSFIVLLILFTFSGRLTLLKSIIGALVVSEIVNLALYWPLKPISKTLLIAEFLVIIDAYLTDNVPRKSFITYSISVILIGVLILWLEYYKV